MARLQDKGVYVARRCRRAELPPRSGFLSSVSERGGGPRRAGQGPGCRGLGGAGSAEAALGRQCLRTVNMTSLLLAIITQLWWDSQRKEG